eukprot:gnl/TRDRNA2_/TRDRNA2_79365_c0_seq1.p1 gnl/TRDRNA2_/TRDRNA2_79365_c0~~gnl/TRDRNA2_/TRDRNA2_79365_c0_seq1.p1  ORF type:complete len:187 (-),score=27.86 gnl/TRDRNA2_/TRDRNA2_79365_c0_seq1:261-821(-)
MLDEQIKLSEPMLQEASPRSTPCSGLAACTLLVSLMLIAHSAGTTLQEPIDTMITQPAKIWQSMQPARVGPFMQRQRHWSSRMQPPQDPVRAVVSSRPGFVLGAAPRLMTFAAGPALTNHDQLPDQLKKSNVVLIDNRGPGELESDPLLDGAIHAEVQMMDPFSEIDKAISDGRIPEDKDTPMVLY